MKKIKKVFGVLFLVSFLSNSNESYADDINDGINKIAAIINDSKLSLSNKESKVEPIVKSLMNYNKFFSYIAGSDFWSSLSANEKSKIIEKNNKGYIKDYFNKITECNTFSVKEIVSVEEIGDSTKQKRLFSYTCDKETKNLDVITIGGKILDVQIAGVSFIQTEKAKLTNLNSNDEKKRVLFRENK